MDDEDTGTGGDQPTGIRDVFQGDGTGSSFILVRDVRADPFPAWDRPWEISSIGPPGKLLGGR